MSVCPFSVPLLLTAGHVEMFPLQVDCHELEISCSWQGRMYLVLTHALSLGISHPVCWPAANLEVSISCSWPLKLLSQWFGSGAPCSQSGPAGASGRSLVPHAGHGAGRRLLVFQTEQKEILSYMVTKPHGTIVCRTQASRGK